jgi:hypothetical protein
MCDFLINAIVLEHAPAAMEGGGAAYFEDEISRRQPEPPKKTQTRGLRQLNSPTSATGWPKKWKEVREHGSRRPFGHFWAAPVTQPVESVGHNTGLTFMF